MRSSCSPQRLERISPAPACSPQRAGAASCLRAVDGDWVPVAGVVELSGRDPDAAAVLEGRRQGTTDQDPDRRPRLVGDEVDGARVAIVRVPSGAGPHEVAHVTREHDPAEDPLPARQLEWKVLSGPPTADCFD